MLLSTNYVKACAHNFPNPSDCREHISSHTWGTWLAERQGFFTNQAPENVYPPFQHIFSFKMPLLKKNLRNTNSLNSELKINQNPVPKITTSVKTQNTFHDVPTSAAFLCGVLRKAAGHSYCWHPHRMLEPANQPAHRFCPPPQSTHKKDPHKHFHP